MNAVRKWLKDNYMVQGLLWFFVLYVGAILAFGALFGPKWEKFKQSEATAYEKFKSSCLEDNKLYECEARWKATAWYR